MNRYEHVDRTPPMEETLPADGDGHHEALQAATADQGEAITKLRRRRGRPMGTRGADRARTHSASRSPAGGRSMKWAAVPSTLHAARCW